MPRVSQEQITAVLAAHVAWATGQGGERADLSGAKLSGADLSRANLSGADLSGAKLSGADLSRANLSGADLSGADLSGAKLSGADLYGAKLSGADLSGAKLSGADLYGADLSGADLSGAKLSRANLYGADLYGADLHEKQIKHWLQIGPIGSRRDTTLALQMEGGDIWIETGCFAGTLATFRERLRTAHPRGQYRREYDAALAMIETIWAMSGAEITRQTSVASDEKCTPSAPLEHTEC